MVVVAFLVVFFGSLSAREAFHALHKYDCNNSDPKPGVITFELRKLRNNLEFSCPLIQLQVGTLAQLVNVVLDIYWLANVLDAL